LVHSDQPERTDGHREYRTRWGDLHDDLHGYGRDQRADCRRELQFRRHRLVAPTGSDSGQSDGSDAGWRAGHDATAAALDKHGPADTGRGPNVTADEPNEPAADNPAADIANVRAGNAAGRDVAANITAAGNSARCDVAANIT